MPTPNSFAIARQGVPEARNASILDSMISGELKKIPVWLLVEWRTDRIPHSGEFLQSEAGAESPRFICYVARVCRSPQGEKMMDPINPLPLAFTQPLAFAIPQFGALTSIPKHFRCKSGYPVLPAR